MFMNALCYFVVLFIVNHFLLLIVYFINSINLLIFIINQFYSKIISFIN